MKAECLFADPSRMAATHPSSRQTDMARSTRSSSRTRPAALRRSGHMVFTRRNYVLMAAGVIAVLLGYVMMRLENEVDGIISLYVAPIIILGGYLEIIYAILWHPRDEKPEGAQPAS